MMVVIQICVVALATDYPPNFVLNITCNTNIQFSPFVPGFQKNVVWIICGALFASSVRQTETVRGTDYQPPTLIITACAFIDHLV